MLDSDHLQKNYVILLKIMKISQQTRGNKRQRNLRSVASHSVSGLPFGLNWLLLDPRSEPISDRSWDRSYMRKQLAKGSDSSSKLAQPYQKNRLSLIFDDLNPRSIGSPFFFLFQWQPARGNERQREATDRRSRCLPFGQLPPLRSVACASV